MGFGPMTSRLRIGGSTTELRRPDETYKKIVERETGFEPATLGLGSRCSTAELLPLANFLGHIIVGRIPQGKSS